MPPYIAYTFSWKLKLSCLIPEIYFFNISLFCRLEIIMILLNWSIYHFTLYIFRLTKRILEYVFLALKMCILLVVYDGIKARDKRAFMGYFLQVLWLKHIKQEDDGKSLMWGTDNAIKLYVHLKNRKPTKPNFISFLILDKVFRYTIYIYSYKRNNV